MRTVEVSVTAEHIAAGEKKNCERCPVALALHDAMPSVSVLDVQSDLITLMRGGFHAKYTSDTPDEVRQFVCGFDAGEPVDPFTFALEVPDWAVAA